MRHLTVTGTRTRARMAATQRATSVGLGHQAGAEAALLHAVRGAADVEVDLVVAEALADRGGLGEPGRIGAAELQGDRMLLGAERQQPLAVAMQDRLRRHHLGVEPRAPRQQPMEEPAMPIRPIHHGRDAEAVAQLFQIGLGA